MLFFLLNCCKAGRTRDKSVVILVCSVAICLTIGVDSSRILGLSESVNFACDEMRLAFDDRTEFHLEVIGHRNICM